MIDFRYHVVSLVSVFLALAVGVALGAGLLGGALSTGLASSETDDSGLRDQVAARDRLQSFQSGFADGVAPTVLGDKLGGQGVVLFVLPGADGSAVRTLGRDVAAAGGKVTAQVGLTRKLVDPSGRQFAEGVADQSLDGVQGAAGGDGDGYARVGAALARAYLTTGTAPDALDESATTIVSAFTESGLVKAQPATQRGTLALVVAGAPSRSGAGEVVAATTAGLDAGSKGAVVAGDAAAARGDGAVAAVRGDDVAGSVSTVDSADTATGAAVAVLALAEQLRGEAGQYGAIDAADGALPRAGS